MTKREQELASRFEERKNNPERLERDAVEVNVKRPSSHVVSIRLSSEEFLELIDAAEAAGVKVGDYVKGALRIRRKLDTLVHAGALEVMSDAISDSDSLLQHRWFGNPLPYRTPDFPPRFVASI